MDASPADQDGQDTELVLGLGPVSKVSAVVALASVSQTGSSKSTLDEKAHEPALLVLRRPITL